MYKEGLVEDFQNILDSIDIIQERFENIKTSKDFVNTTDGTFTLDGIAMRLQVIGELIKNIDKFNKDFLSNYSEVSWTEIIKLRDLISHHYFKLDEISIFETCKSDLPVLKSTVEKIIKDLSN